MMNRRTFLGALAAIIGTTALPRLSPSIPSSIGTAERASIYWILATRDGGVYVPARVIEDRSRPGVADATIEGTIRCAPEAIQVERITLYVPDLGWQSEGRDCGTPFTLFAGADLTIVQDVRFE